jgi:hypothetical protein
MLRAPTFLDPTEKLVKRPMFTKVVTILLSISMTITITNNKGDKGSHYLKSREILKNFVDLPLTNIEKHIEEIQCAIPLNYFSPKQHLLSIYSKSLN